MNKKAKQQSPTHTRHAWNLPSNSVLFLPFNSFRMFNLNKHDKYYIKQFCTVVKTGTFKLLVNSRFCFIFFFNKDFLHGYCHDAQLQLLRSYSIQ